MVSVAGVFEKQAIPLLAKEARSGIPRELFRWCRIRCLHLWTGESLSGGLKYKKVRR
jgi:hypothetical protein